jgi:hypothetical protein
VKPVHHPLLAWLTTALLAVAALLPAGMMPVADALHIQVRFCSENPLLAAQTIVIERDGASQLDDMGDNPCPFATLAPVAALLPPNVPLAAPALRAAETVHGVMAHVAPGLGLAAPPPYPTGPPLI